MFGITSFIQWRGIENLKEKKIVQEWNNEFCKKKGFYFCNTNDKALKLTDYENY
ncbi:5817_t:CDS:2 [Entrophospora sp. SA101]|nr:5817_t:CDS:2 [Entrophospora sp. SA101]